MLFEKSIPRQTEDKVFSLRQSKRNAGRYGVNPQKPLCGFRGTPARDLIAIGVYTGVLKKSLDFLGFTGTSSDESDEKQ